MKKILVIGSTVVDVIIRLDHLPRTAEDVNVEGQQMSMGGCAYNAAMLLRHMGVPHCLFSPVGTGAYGDFVREHFRRRNMEVLLPVKEENGCCYCFVENGGERTFLSYHGAEYRFSKEWFDRLDPQAFSSAYFCGLEMEEPTGKNILTFLEEHPHIQPYFAPGPRFQSIDRGRMEQIFALHPVLHLNESEALSAARDHAGPPAGSGVEAAARALHGLTGNTVVVTLGDRGSWYETGTDRGMVPGYPVTPMDTIGAGDAHIGALMGLLAKGLPLPRALRIANRLSAAVVATRGAVLSSEEFARVWKECAP